MRLARACALCALVALGGCAWAARQKDVLLVQSGFAPLPADAATAAGPLPPQRFVHRVVNGVPTVFYADPIGCGCVYAGPESAFEAYQGIREAQLAAFTQSLGQRSTYSR